jgi:hypothetical protein
MDRHLPNRIVKVTNMAKLKSRRSPSGSKCLSDSNGDTSIGHKTVIGSQRIAPPTLSHDFRDTIKHAKMRYQQKRAREREQLQEGSMANGEFWQSLDAKECALEIQAMILGKLAAEENVLKGLVDGGSSKYTQETFARRMNDVLEAISMLKY